MLARPKYGYTVRIEYTIDEQELTALKVALYSAKITKNSSSNKLTSNEPESIISIYVR